LTVVNRSSKSEYVGVWAAGRRITDLPSTLRAPARLKTSAAAYTNRTFGTRWGDHSGVVLDADGQSFVSAMELPQTANTWTTWLDTIPFNLLPN
jgi:hypothetical protein